MDTMSEFQNPWPAPLATRPLSRHRHDSGSKSLSNRYLILAAMGRRPVTLVGSLRSRDTDLMMGALASLGVEFQVDPDDETTVRVTPPSSGRFTGDVDVYCGLAGTVMRFVPGLAMFADGAGAVRRRRTGYRSPDEAGIGGLEQLGAHIEIQWGIGTTAVHADSACGIRRDECSDACGVHRCVRILPVHLRPVADRRTSVQRIGTAPHGDHLPSLPHIRMTVADLQSAGCHRGCG